MGEDPEERVHSLAKTLNILPLLNKPVSELSVGQQQRVACARALVGKPSLIIADEPTSSLDEDNAHELMNLLNHEWENEKFALLFVGHDKRLARHFDRNLALSEINAGGAS
jgi:putative ABC transport system ATP-binding protein